MRSIADRKEAWQRLGEILEPNVFDNIAKEIKLDTVVETANQLLAGKVRGRIVVDVQAD
jgi:acrylyl-CoA reductase (NADPH)